jgi:lipopolysaccharide export system permease protein
MKIASKFLARRFLSSVTLVLLLVLGVIFAITFMEKLPGAPSAAAALGAAAIQMMELLPLFLPMTVFMGTLLASYNLTRSSELVILQGGGLSPYQIMRPYLAVAIVLGAFTAMVLNPYFVRLSNADINSNKLVLVDGAVWLREASDAGAVILRARDMGIDKDAFVFKDATIFRQDAAAKLIDRIEARRALLTDGKFSGRGATIYNSDGTSRANADWEIQTVLNRQTVLERYLKPNQISFWRLPWFILDMQRTGITSRGHLIQFWTLLFLPLSLVAMVVLGVAFSQTHERRNYSFGLKFGMGIVACFALYFIMNVFSALGVSGGLPTLLSVLAPPIIIIAGAATFIVSYDTI